MTALSDADFDVSRDALIATGGNIARAAERLGVSRPTLSMRLKRHPELWPDGIDRRKRGRPLRGDVAVVEAAVDLVRRADEPAPHCANPSCPRPRAVNDLCAVCARRDRDR